jgi:hypothetical protein
MAVLEELAANLKRARYALLLVALVLAADVGWTRHAAAQARVTHAWDEFKTCRNRFSLAALDAALAQPCGGVPAGSPGDGERTEGVRDALSLEYHARHREELPTLQVYR